MFISGSLGSKVGRRLTVMFLLVAAVPALLMTAFTYKSLSDSQESQTIEQLRLEAKLYGLILIERLNTAQSIASNRYGNDTNPEAIGTQSNQGILESVSYLDKPIEIQHFYATLNDAQIDHLKVQGSVLLLVQPFSPPALTEPISLVRIQDKDVFINWLAPNYLWGGIENLPKGTTSVRREDQLLFQASLEPGSADNELQNRAVGSWTFYLDNLGEKPWTVSVSVPLQESFSSNDHLTTKLSFILSFSVLLVILLSLTQIRKIMEPLATIRANIMRLGTAETAHSQEVKSGDEFEEVAKSLDNMAKDLRLNFKLQEQLSELDALILKGGSYNDVLISASNCAELILGHSNVHICLFNRENTGYFYSPSASPKRLKIIFPDSGEGSRANLKNTRLGLLNAKEIAALKMVTGIENIANSSSQGVWYTPIGDNNQSTGFLIYPVAEDEKVALAQQEKILYLSARVAVAASALAQQELLSFQANFDSLTKLPNRNTLNRRLEYLVAKNQTKPLHFSLLFLDLNGFKKVNDQLGHDIGDKLLMDVADRLSAIGPRKSLLSRLGGDEFVLLIKESPEMLSFAEVSRLAISTIEKPFFVDRNRISIGVSIGAAVFPTDGANAEDMLKNADIAMYEAKKSRESNVLRYAESMSSKGKSRQALVESLDQALENHELTWHLQPKISATSGKIVGAESLIRWQLPNGDYVNPQDFIGVAEETGQIEKIGHLAIQTVCSQLAELKERGHTNLSIAVNVSLVEFRERHFVKRIADIVKSSGANPALIEIEITESVAAKSLSEANAKILGLSSLGLKIVLDDFGTGFSSLSYIQKLDFDAVKIDRSFIRELTVDSDEYSINRAIIQMAHTLEKQVIAEGVETIEQASLLKELNCDYLQGFLYSKAVPLDAFIELLENQ